MSDGDLHSGRTIRSFQDFVPLSLQIVASHAAEIGLVFHDKNGLHGLHSFFRCHTWLRCGEFAHLNHAGQIHFECGSFTGLAGHPYVAAALFDDPIYRR